MKAVRNYPWEMEKAKVAVSSPAEWAAACSESFVPLKVRTVDPRFKASLSHVALGERVGVTRVASHGSEVYRSSRLIAQEPRDDLLLSIHGTGTGTVAQDERVATLTRGTATLYDSSRPYVLSFPEVMSEVVIQVPRDALGLTESFLREVTATTIQSSAPLRALSTLATEATATDATGVEPLEGQALASAAINLLRAALAPAAAAATAVHDHLALRISMVEFIEQNLTDATLCAESVARHHHVSLRHAQMIFADAGDTIAGRIRRRRLELASVLMDGGMGVTTAGAHAGFVDHGTFTRAYKRHYNMLPSDYWSLVQAPRRP